MGEYVPYSTVSISTHSDAAELMVSNRFDTMSSVADNFLSSATALQGSLTGILTSIGDQLPSTTDIESISVTPQSVELHDNEPPTFSDFDTESLNSLLNGISIPGVTTIDMPTYDAPSGVGSIYTASSPSTVFPAAPGKINIDTIDYTSRPDPVKPNAVTLNSIEIPDKPEIEYPDELVLDELIFPSPPILSEISFEGIRPTDSNINTPGAFSYNMTVFAHSEVWNAALNKLESDLVDGSTGLDADVEAAIFQRYQDRQQVTNDRLYQEAEALYGSQGFNLPTGIIVAKLAEIKSEIARKEDDASLDIMIKQAELAQNNSQFVIDKSLQVGQFLQNFYVQSETLSFNIALEIHNKAIEIYNAQVALYQLKFEAYKTEAAVYESLIRSELSKVEKYKIQVEAVGIQSEAQKNLVALYAQKLAVLDIKTKVYANQLEGSKVRLSQENLKIETYKTMIQAYAEELQANKIDVDVYKAKIEAENNKVNQYRAHVDAYQAGVTAEAARLQSLVDIERLKVESSMANVERYKADIQAAIADMQAQASAAGAQAEIARTASANYAAQNSAMSEIVRAVAAMNSTKIQEASANYSSQIQNFTATVQAKQDYNRTLIAKMQADVSLASAKIDEAMKRADVLVRGYVGAKELEVKGTEGALNVAAQIASSAMNAVNASASFGYSGGASVSSQHGIDMRLSESHNFQE